MEKAIDNNRVSQIDFLRSVAIILVLFRHHASINYLQNIGWVGVDLFFVLSGFLVTSLIYKEYQASGKFSIRNFLIRRGLKIYPLFYIFICISLLFIASATYLFSYEKSDIGIKTLAEMFFIQNYFEGLWGHTWTLAIEEHFYLIISLALFLIVKIAPAAFGKVPYVIMVLLVIILLLRISNLSKLPEVELRTHVYLSHLRVDSLLFGSLLAYYFVFSKNIHVLFGKKGVKLTACVTGIVILFFTLRCDLLSPFMVTFGFTLIYFGFGLILLSSLSSTLFFKRLEDYWVYRSMCLIGKYSYAIYLFHMFLPSVFDNSNLFAAIDYRLRFIVYLLVSISAGIIISSKVEYPILKVRDKLFPGHSKAISGK